MNALEIKHLYLRIKNFEILSGIEFTVPAGVVCALIGPNGAGKTTTIKSILKLYHTTGAKINIIGKEIYNSADITNLGYVPEKENFSNTKVINWLLFLSSLRQQNVELNRKTIEKYMERFDIMRIKNLRMSNLSSGQKKIIMIIQALINNDNQIYIMDEPTEHLDPEARQIFYQIVAELNKQGKSFIISTHNLDEIKKFASYVVFIRNGKVIHQGQFSPNDDLYKIFNNDKLNAN
ncbi:MAG: ABC transporter ATP-binding protein [Mycoplasmataceae bacterium]|jgi:ABC-2 type transport system ATP-binding protein|nr:ABC transporter ATP-binding protein [Mycoplasmataceae bacterium]